MPVPSFAFVSVFAWPIGWTREQMIDALSRCVGIDPADAALRVAKSAPLAIIRMEERPAGAAVRALRDMGVLAFAPTLKQLNGLPGAVPAKRLTRARGSDSAMYLVEPWRGESIGLSMSEVSLVIRAAVVSRRSTAGDPTTKIRFDAMSGTMHLDRVEGPSQRTSLAEIIELHTAEGHRIRIDGNKFNFDVLGDQRELSDAVNARQLAARLISEAPRAPVDEAFPTFAPPPGAVRALDAGATLARSRMPEFEFYSAWLHILYRLAVGS
jgi:hypothetical protein